MGLLVKFGQLVPEIFAFYFWHQKQNFFGQVLGQLGLKDFAKCYKAIKCRTLYPIFAKKASCYVEFLFRN